MGRTRFGLAVVTFVCAGSAVGAPAAAAPPSNDTVMGATPIGGLPFFNEVDTSEATTDQAELDAIAPCAGVPAVERAVWYVAQVTTDAAAVRTDVSGSDYSAGIAVFVGEPTAAGFVACAPGSIQGPVSSGQTLYLMVFGDTVGDPGSTLRISIEAVELPTVEVTIDGVGAVDAKTGVAQVSGTVTCTGDVAFVDVSGTLRQRPDSLRAGPDLLPTDRAGVRRFSHRLGIRGNRTARAVQGWQRHRHGQRLCLQRGL